VVRQGSTPLNHRVNRTGSIQVFAAGALALLAVTLFAWIIFRGRSDPDGKVYFYDLSQKKLFPAPRSSVPPIRGIDNEEADGVRAIVISDTSDSSDRKHRHIAYLEKYTPELKAQFEAVQKTGAAGPNSIRRELVPANTLVRRLSDPEWFSMDSVEGEKIVSEWNVPGPNGNYPVVCVP
jgi:hypothetical protein